MDEPSGDVLALAYERLLSVVVDAPGLEAFLDQVVRLAGQLVSPAAACGLTMRRDGHPYTVASSDRLAIQVDEIQYGVDEGPCLQALHDGVPIQIDDLAADPRWPRYRVHATALGVVSSLSLPVKIDGQTVAAMNLYSDRLAAFDGRPRQLAAAFTAQCGAALKLILHQADEAKSRAQLGEAMLSRSIIDQTIGILMSQQHCTANDAFDLLRQASQHRNRKLRDVAADIITKVSGAPPQPPNEFKV